jgi:hypothetical protein
VFYVFQKRLFRSPWPATDTDDAIRLGAAMALDGISAQHAKASLSSPARATAGSR